MKDRDFLMWLHARFVNVYGEDECVDWLHKLRSVIAHIPAEQESSSTGLCLNSLEDLIKLLGPKHDVIITREIVVPVPIERINISFAIYNKENQND
jgi:hypothetical protein